jgi:hypothetical protein
MPIYDRIKFTTPTAPGTGPVTVGSAVSGFRTPAGAGIPDGTTNIPYAIEDGTAWETGTGTYTTSGTTFSRTVSASSNSNNLLNLSSSATMFVTPIASNIGYSVVSSVTGTAPIASSGGTTPAISISAATTSAAGSMSAADKAKLDNITYVKLASGFNTTSTISSPVGLAFAVAATDTNYVLELFCSVSSSAIATGIQLGIEADAATNLVSSSAYVRTPSGSSAAGSERLGPLTSGGSVVASPVGTPVANASYPANITATIRTLGGSGNIGITLNSEINGSSVSIAQGAILRITKVS